MRKGAREIEFNVDAYTARLIGRENVSKLEGAIMEIVKNAYDADAKVFCLYYSNSENCIYIMDNGVGMEEQIIRDHWMTIGNSSKKNIYISKNKRIQTGAKGIGRFALDRISDRCSMLTVSEKGPDKVKKLDKFVFVLKESADVFRVRREQKVARYRELLQKKKQGELVGNEEDEYLNLYKVLSSYGLVEKLPKNMLNSDFEQHIDKILKLGDTILEKYNGK